MEFQSPRGEGVVQTILSAFHIAADSRASFNHLAVRG